MRESPRTRRLRSDLQALELLRQSSTVFDFVVPRQTRPSMPESYILRFRGRGLWRQAADTEDVSIRGDHEVSVELGADYPRLIPALSWRTPIFHPNISGNGVVCLGGYATHWAPSLNLGELCTMLWDMVRYKNYDVESPYNREAAHWAKTQSTYLLPLDPRPIRDLLANRPASSFGAEPPVRATNLADAARKPADEVVVAEVVESDGPEILFID